MTEIYILDKNFKTIGLVDGFTSLIWRRKYIGNGEYELHLPGGELFELIQSGKYLYRADTKEAALIERVQYLRENNGGRKVVAAGRFLEALLSERVIYQITEISGNAEAAIRGLVAINAISGTAEEGREIAGLTLGETNNVGGEISQQLNGENLLEAIETICTEQEIAIKVELDFLRNAMVFSVWQGKDRTTAQRVNSWAIFSDDFENINASGYERDIHDYKNIAYVHGQKEDESEIIVEVDNRETENEERKEIFVDAISARQKTEEKTLTDNEFIELLKQKGLEALAEYPLIEAVEGDVRDGGNLVYRKDFDLGDLCEYVDNEIGVEAVGRITEVVEYIEGGKTEISATLGDAGRSFVKKIIRRESSK